jgi:hypothetical protein
MKAIHELLTDKQRSQRGSVLSGVLIMLTFIGIISGALMTELSTNFLISSVQTNRTANQATVNSAVELAMSQLQARLTVNNAGCPSAPQTLKLNGDRTAVFTYSNCRPTVREQPQFTRLSSYSSPFRVDGTHAQPKGLDDYVVGDSGGNVFDYTFGASSPRWVRQLGGAVTAPPLVIPNPSRAGAFVDVIPMSAPGCSGAPYCLIVLDDNTSTNPPPVRCSIPVAGGPVLSQPGANVDGSLVYYGDGSRIDAVSFSGGRCTAQFSVSTNGNQPVVAGPVAFGSVNNCGNGNGNGNAESVYAVVSDGSSSRVVTIANDEGDVSGSQSLLLPWGNAKGIDTAVSAQGASIVVTFRDGGVALVHISCSGRMTLAGPRPVLPSGISSAPYWCVPCGDRIGVGTQSGGLYLFDQSLNQYASYLTMGSPISTTPAADAAGNWYAASDDGYVHLLQVRAAPTMAEINKFGQMGQPGSAIAVGFCATGICVYLGGLDSHAYLIPLDARETLIAACINSCSGAHLQLVAHVVVGALTTPRTVSVRCWSYIVQGCSYNSG